MIFNKSKEVMKWAISFWIGVGLMSIVNVWRISYNFNSISYYWIMFAISIMFIIISIFLINRKN